MKRFKKLFSFEDKSKDVSGVYASIEELLDLRKKTKYIKAFNWNKFTTHNAGDVKSAFKGRGIEVEEIRQYINGDDVRDIDWRVSARKSSPYTKLYAEEKDREIYVLLDLSKSMCFGTQHEFKSVSAAKIASLLGWLAIENKDKFGCLIYDGRENHLFKPQSSVAQMMAVVKKISAITKDVLERPVEPELGLEKSLQLLEKTIKSKASVFVISDFMELNDNLAKKIAAVSKRSKLYIVNVFDVLEEVAPKANEYMVEYGNEKLVFDSFSKDFQKEYKNYFLGRKEKVKDFCNKFLCSYMEIRTDIPVLQQIRI